MIFTSFRLKLQETELCFRPRAVARAVAVAVVGVVVCFVPLMFTSQIPF